MSGGSFNFLCQVLDGSRSLGERRCDIERMAKYLDGLGYLTEAGATRKVLDALDQADALATELQQVWKAAEWHDSGDWGPQLIMDAAVQYRAAALIAARKKIEQQAMKEPG